MNRPLPGGHSKEPMRRACRHAWMDVGGFYERDLSNPNGMLAGYAGEYEPGKQWVGDVYYNFAKVEVSWEALPLFATALASGIAQYGMEFDAIVGVEMGSVRLSGRLGEELKVPWPFAEKRGKEVVFDRHSLKPGSRVLICEDVLNNFSTTMKLIELITDAGCMVVGIVAAMNRSPEGRIWFPLGDIQLPILSVLFNPQPEYRHDDPYVAELIKARRVVWKPKLDWETLVA